jgi:hypothetical protein
MKALLPPRSIETLRLSAQEMSQSLAVSMEESGNDQFTLRGKGPLVEETHEIVTESGLTSLRSELTTTFKHRVMQFFSGIALLLSALFATVIVGPHVPGGIQVGLAVTVLSMVIALAIHYIVLFFWLRRRHARIRACIGKVRIAVHSYRGAVQLPEESTPPSSTESREGRV